MSNSYISETISVTAGIKDHKCSWCGQKILKGDPYSKYRCLDDGRFNTIKLHPECLHVVKMETEDWCIYGNERGIGYS